MIREKPKKVNPSIWVARSIGTEARRRFVPSFSGKVLAVFPTTVYLSGWGGEILWLAREGLPLHRRCLSVSFLPQGLCPGKIFGVQGKSLRIDGNAVIDLDGAATWEPPSIGPEKAAPLVAVEASFQQMLGAIKVPESGDGFGRGIPLISALAEGKKPVFSQSSLLMFRALRPILNLGEASLGKDMGRLAMVGRELIGMGPGLTPSGDDFLGGLLFAVRSLKRAYPWEFPWDEQPILDLMEWARTRTHPISYTLLRDLALGHGPEPFHEIVAALLEGKDPGRAVAGANRLVRIGHASGLDMLAGFLTGMLMVLKMHRAGRKAVGRALRSRIITPLA